MSTPARRGRRPGSPDTRAEILAQARALFSAQGYPGTSVRAIAAAAGVDAALVHHYFGTKDEHLVPGRGTVGAAEFLRHVSGTGFRGEIVLEINTRKAGSREEREKDLRESLDFAREHFFAATS